MNDWTKITGLEANAIAEQHSIARPGTFNAIVLKWNGETKPPTFLTLKGNVRCLSCNSSTPFELRGMSGQGKCSGCPARFNLFSGDYQHEGCPVLIAVATIFSRPVSGPVAAPQLDITAANPA